MSMADEMPRQLTAAVDQDVSNIARRHAATKTREIFQARAVLRNDSRGISAVQHPESTSYEEDRPVGCSSVNKDR